MKNISIDKLLNRAEQDIHDLQKREKNCRHCLKKMKNSKERMQQVLDKEKAPAANRNAEATQ
jgi:hypothetical protein